MHELVERFAVGHRELPEGASVGGPSEIARFEAEDGALLLGRPDVPPRAAELVKAGVSGDAVHESRDLCDRSSPEREVPLGEERKTVRHLVDERGQGEMGDSTHALLVRVHHPPALIPDHADQVEVLHVRRTFGVWLVVRMHYASFVGVKGRVSGANTTHFQLSVYRVS